MEYFINEEKYNPLILILIFNKLKDIIFSGPKEVGDSDKTVIKSVMPENYKSEGKQTNIKIKCSEGFYWDKTEFKSGLMCTDTKQGDIKKEYSQASLNVSFYQIIFNRFFALQGTIFLFYSFSPLGSRLRKNKQQKNNIDYYLQDDYTQHLMERTSISLGKIE
ncbi:PIR Superfamily Protein [Plasmodium ovale curtisi]|uniref:PIR Superfamily Protein n=1 Tax=Plasmodium ovale curtisi TaxID=864141 RepID=A0A1A8X447_PLAOA|nr:PIR Superfamily Protein [Plasmodium ovale curtisi]